MEDKTGQPIPGRGLRHSAGAPAFFAGGAQNPAAEGGNGPKRGAFAGGE